MNKKKNFNEFVLCTLNKYIINPWDMWMDCGSLACQPFQELYFDIFG